MHKAYILFNSNLDSILEFCSKIILSLFHNNIVFNIYHIYGSNIIGKDFILHVVDRILILSVSVTISNYTKGKNLIFM